MEDNLVKKESMRVPNRKVIWAIIIIICVSTLGIIGFYKYKDYKFNTNIAEANKSFEADNFSEAKDYYQAAMKYKVDNNITEPKIKLCDDVEGSFKDYNTGNKLLADKNYLGAYNSFKKVIPQDVKRYDIAKDKISQSGKLYEDTMFAEAVNLASKTDYQKAIDDMTSILNIDSKNEKAKSLKLQYQSSFQQKVEEEKRAELERKRQEAESAKQQEISNARNTIKIVRLYTSNPNSASGVDLHIVWKNTSNKIMKYVTFKVVPFNAVEDVQRCDIRGYSNYNSQVTGPINAGVTYGDGRLWENAWYNYTITHAKCVGINITYMDDSSASLDENQVQYVLP